jgi:preprotein translocase subunit SecA
MFNWIIKHTIGTKHDRDVKRMKPLVEKINSLESGIANLTDAELRAQTDIFRNRLEHGETLEQILPESFAVAREAAKRTLNMRHFDVQLMGGIVLHEGRISEMKTGEGKTLVATLPVYLNALSGKGVHLVTVNDYLAKRDANWMRPIYEILGLSVGIIQHDMNHSERQTAYNADITYGTNNEYGFDYLRDNMVIYPEERVQRKHNYAIVDEVDSILIDEARTPLIISGPAEESTDKYYKADKKVLQLIRENVILKEEDIPQEEMRLSLSGASRGKRPGVTYTKYFELDEKGKNVILTEDGNQRIEDLIAVGNLYDPKNIEWVHTVNQALKAHTLFQRDVDYVVKDGEVMIVDEFTGRLMPGRRYSDGLHQALEAKESVRIAEENQTLASITFQNYFRKYKKLGGMTGTADTESVEFKKIYNLDVAVIPTNVPMIRVDNSDRVYRTEKEKFDAIINEIIDCHQRKQPVLVGTISIEKSEKLGALLKKSGVRHNILNAKFHEMEAEIVAEAGKPGAVTIATNMAGRGTDIVLGGSRGYDDFLEKHIPVNVTTDIWRQFKRSINTQDFDKSEELIHKMIGQDKAVARQVNDKARIWIKEHNLVKEAGGLHILGTERHESRRIDNQLRGRSGRQGDEGSSRFYLSLEDNLMRIFGSDRISKIMQRLGMEEGQEIEHPWVTKAIANAQKRVESHNFEIRKHLLEYDEAMNAQREKIYGIRNFILDNKDISQMFGEYLEDVAFSISEKYCSKDIHVEDWDIEGLQEHFKNSYNLNLNLSDNDPLSIKREQFYEFLYQELKKGYESKKEKLGEDIKILERMVILQVLDNKWKDHLYSMDHLREGIWTSSYSERNPLVEYKREGFIMFQNMFADMKEEVVEILMKIQVQGAIDEEELFQTAYTAQVESRDAILPMQFSAPSGSAAELADKYEIDSSNISESGTYLSQRKPKKEDSITIGSHKRKSSRRSRRKK